MTLSVGAQLGPFEITGTLGKGGMGEVYRARDPKLEREVAIKVLPESFTSDAGRVARFEQEAKTLAALNHPNIAHVYGLEQDDGQSAIVMDLVEGPTLADRIEQGPIPADEALGIAMQIAAALEAAHERGIVHRDLKPANIKLKADGAIKVLDFGIAKAAAHDSGDGGVSPIMTTPATQIGVILGTAAYMSPEQARGKPVDQRTDVWAFGCVLYEMQTGQLAFGGEDVAVTLARVIANDTDLDSLPATISPAVQRTIELCLRKDPKKRVADIRDVRLALAGEFETAGPAAAGETAAASAQRGPGWAGLAAAALVTAVAAAALTFVYTGNDEAEPPRGTRFSIDMPEDGTLGLDGQSQSVAISPDGRTIAFATLAGPNQYTWHLRPIDALAATPLRGTEPDFETPLFSPDGRWLAFDSGTLWRLSVLGGAPTEIVTLDGRTRGASWGENDEIIYGGGNFSGLQVISANGGEPEQLTQPERGTSHRWPDWLPGNRAVVFAQQQGQSSQIAVADRATGDVRVLIPDGTSPVWLDSGHLVYGVADGTLRAVRFDDETLTIIGDPVAIDGIGDQPIAMTTSTMGMHYAVASDGTLLYGTRSAGNATATGIVPYQPGWLTADGEFTPLDMEPCYCRAPAVSPDGTRIAMVMINAGDVRQTRDIWVLSLENNSFRRLTFEPTLKSSPIWSLDSTRIAYADTERGIVIRRADGTGETETIWADRFFVASWAPDDRLLIERPGTGSLDIAAIEARPGAEPVTLLTSGETEENPVVSPDGRWVAYRNGPALFVRPYPNAGDGQWQISEAAGLSSFWAWSSDSERLYFADGARLMVTDIGQGPAFSFSTPRQVHDLQGYLQEGYFFGFALEPGTDRVLVARPVGENGDAGGDEQDTRRLVVIQDFDEIVRELLPVE